MTTVHPSYLPASGRCECGSLTYRLNAAPISLHLCHCAGCQRQSGSAFGMSLIVPRAGFTFEGEPAIWVRTGPTGRLSDCYFCPTCGSRIANAHQGAETMALKAGTLDDTSWLRPVADIWMREAQPWPLDDPGRIRCEQLPEDFAVLRAAYAAQQESAG